MDSFFDYLAMLVYNSLGYQKHEGPEIVVDMNFEITKASGR